MSSVASAIPTSNHNKNECGLSVLWHDCSCSQQSSPKISNDLPSICSGVFHTWIWVKKNSMLKKPTCAGLQVPLYQQKYGVWCQATMSVHFCKRVLIENEHHSSEAKSTTIVSRQIPRQNKAEMYVNVKSTRGGQVIAFLLLLRMMMSSVPPPLIPWGSSNSELSLHSAFYRIAYAPNTQRAHSFQKDEYVHICAHTDTDTHTTCTSTRVSNQREQIHFLYILRFPRFLMAQKKESSELQIMQVLQLFMRKMKLRIAKSWR
jgi:hypothetical protein